MKADGVTLIAITGVGLISPAGLGLEASLSRLSEGPLVAEPPPPDQAEVPSPERLVVPGGFKPRAYLHKKRRKDLKLMAPANRLAVAAAVLAVEDAGLSLDDGEALLEAGLFMGVGREPGSLKDILPALAHSLDADGEFDQDRLVDEGMGWMNPLSSLKTLPNMSLAHVAIRLRAMGPAQTRCTGPASGLDALAEAIESIRSGRSPRAVAGGTDTRTGFTDRLTAERLGLPGPMGEAAALFVLEPLEAAQMRGARVRALIDLASQPTPVPTDGVFGHSGAGTGAAELALAVGRGETRTLGPVTVGPAPEGPVDTPRAAAVHIKATAVDVVISGVGLATPLGHRFDTFADRILAGQCATGPIRAFDATRFPVRNACEVPAFDARTRMSPALAEQICGLDDRNGELALAAALDALRDHGATDRGLGLAYGTGLSSVSVRELEEDSVPYVTSAGTLDFPRFGAERARATDGQSPRRHLVARPMRLLRDALGLGGPATCHFSACAAAAEAIGHAADCIRRGASEVMLAGGADSMVHPFGMLPFILLGATSTETDPTRAGRPFDADRDGFVMGEGAAFFVLESRARAEAAGRRIYGRVLGWGSSCDAHNVTAPHPEGEGARRAMAAALADAGLSRDTVDYINAHGTGTALNDVTESRAILSLFGEHAPPVSSSKAQFGHTIAAAGAVELLAVLAAFHGGRLPPNPHLGRVDPAIHVDLVEPGGRALAPRVVLSNSFGFGGQNAALVLGHPEDRS